MSKKIDAEAVGESVRNWVKAVVVGLNLCPFAGLELRRNRIRFEVVVADTETLLLASLQDELERLNSDPSIETTLLIHPNVLQDFSDYNQFLETVDELLQLMDLSGTVQIASFHPHYQFAETAEDDVENYTNRSPYPMLHLLREETVARSIETYPDISQIPQRNIALMKRLGPSHMKQLLQACF